MSRVCPRCLLRSGQRVAMRVEHSCPDLDRVCARCRRSVYVEVRRIDARGSFSVSNACGCFYAPTVTPRPTPAPESRP
jgi:hypothetical protein